MRGGAINAFSDLAKASKRSSLGAMMGNRRGGFPETLLRLFCMTRLVAVIRRCVMVRVLYRCVQMWTGLEHNLLGYSVQYKYINGSIVGEEEKRKLEEYGGRGKLKIEKKKEEKRRYNKIEDRGGKGRERVDVYSQK